MRSKLIWGNYRWLLQLTVTDVCRSHCGRICLGCYNYDQVNLILSVFAIIFILFWCVVKIKQKQENIYKIIKIISFVLHFAKEYIYIYITTKI